MFISTNKSDKFCAAATSHASFSPMLQKHGCVAVVNGKIVGKGFNNYRNYSKDGLMRTCCSCHAEVAAIVAESMDNYLLGNHVLKVKLMRPEDVHPETFKGVKGGVGEKVAERSGFKIVPWNKRAAEQHNKKRDEGGERKRLKRLAKKEKERMKKIKESGIEYDFDGGYEKKLMEKMKDLNVKKTTETKKKRKATTTTTTTKETKTKKTKTPARKKVEKIDEEKKEDAKPTPRTARRNRAEARGKKREAEIEKETGRGSKKPASKRTKK